MKISVFIFVVLFFQSCVAMIDNSGNKSFLSVITGGDTVQDATKYLQGKKLDTAIQVKVNGTKLPRFLFRAKQDPISMKFKTNLTSYAALDCNVEVLKYLIKQTPKDKNQFSLIEKDGAKDEADIWGIWFQHCFFEGKFQVSQRKQTIEIGKIIVSHVTESDDKWLQFYFKDDVSAMHEELKKSLDPLLPQNIDDQLKKLEQERKKIGEELGEYQGLLSGLGDLEKKIELKAQELRTKVAQINQLKLDKGSQQISDEQEINLIMLLYILLGDKKTLEIFVHLKKNIYFDMPYFGDASSLHIAFALGDTNIFNYILEQAKSKIDYNVLGNWFEFCLDNEWFAIDKAKNTLEQTNRISNVVQVPVAAPFKIRGLKLFLSDKAKFISSVLQTIPPKEARDKLSEKDEENLADAVDLYALLAVISGDWQMLQKLIDKEIGFDVLTLKGFNDYTLLHLASFVGQKAIVDQLVKTTFFNGNEKDAKGKTPGELAQQQGYAGIADSIQKLKERREAEKKQRYEEQKKRGEKTFDEKLKEQKEKIRKELELPRLVKAIQNLKNELTKLSQQLIGFAKKQS